MKANQPQPAIRVERFLDPVFDLFTSALRNAVVISTIASAVFDVIGTVFQAVSDLANDLVEWFD